MGESADPTAKYMTTSETAARMRISKAALLNMRYRGEGPPAIRLGKRALLFDPAEVDRWLKDRQEPSAKAS